MADVLLDVNATLVNNLTTVKCNGCQIPDDYYVHTRAWFKVLLVVLYTAVFITCLIGNSLVIAVVTLERRMRSATNLFLTNLAAADLMVAMFCIYQNLLLWVLNHEWALGTVLCKVYHFANALAYTSSVLIMVLIAIERYIAIMYPMATRRVLRMSYLRTVTIVVWLLSAAICAPRLWMFDMVQISGQGKSELICILQVAQYDPRLYNMVNFVALFLVPVMVMLFIYIRLAVKLYSTDLSALTIIPTRVNKKVTNSDSCDQWSNNPRNGQGVDESTQVSAYDPGDQSVDRTSVPCFGSRRATKNSASTSSACHSASGKAKWPPKECYLSSILVARRKIIRLLIAVVVAFIVCHFPYHLRKMLQDWHAPYNGGSNEAILFTIFTTLLMYTNSSCNPILYALISHKFRKSMWNIVVHCRNRNNNGLQGGKYGQPMVPLVNGQARQQNGVQQVSGAPKGRPQNGRQNGVDKSSNNGVIMCARNSV
ncbi:Gastrin/cholecystokinin type B receptor [Halotydeus destructor]|nr:Gastrin/cholecystokinin type B receptor [Halotydeus destructor]